MPNLRPPLYDEAAVQPMRDDLIAVGFQEMRSPEEVEQVLSLKDDKITLTVINSVCGCAAGCARPGVMLALQNSVIPDRLTTSFAGQDRDAVDKIREYLKGYTPSSPCMALFKNGEPVFFLPRYEIEGRTFEDVAAILTNEFGKHCSRTGPSIPKEEYDQMIAFQACGSQIPMHRGVSIQ